MVAGFETDGVGFETGGVGFETGGVGFETGGRGGLSKLGRRLSDRRRFLNNIGFTVMGA